MSILSTLVWPVALILLFERLRPLLSRVVDSFFPTPPPDPSQRPAIPPDLAAHANMFTEQFARDAQYQLYDEMFDKLRSWDSVRAALGVQIEAA